MNTTDEPSELKFSIPESTVVEIHTALTNNKLTSKHLVEFYLRQIQTLSPIYKAVIEVNPDAIHEAERADEERNKEYPVSKLPLHGIPVLVKDNMATKDKLNTTAGSVVPRDAGVVRKLRDSGAIIL